MIVRRIFVTAMVSMAMSVAHAEEWESLLGLPGLQIEQDRATLKTEGRVTSAWQRWTYDQDQVFRGVTYRVGRYLIYSNCEHNTRANAQIELIDASGAVVFSGKPPVFVFAPLLRDSLPEVVHKKVCA